MDYILGAQLLKAVADSPTGLSYSQCCRAVNHAEERRCYDCVDYGNKWKRQRGILRTPSCETRKGRVWYALTQLRKLGALWSQLEKRPDPYMTRGWDRMRIYRLN